MNKKAFLVIAGFVVVLFGIFAVGILFFKKDNELFHGDQTTGRQFTRQEKLERKELKTVAEKFAVSYYSYTWGDFSNIESQYYLMTSEMVEREKNRVEKMKKEIKRKPKKYFSKRASLIDSKVELYKDSKAVFNIKLKVDEINGALVGNGELVWIDSEANRIKDKNWRSLIARTTEMHVKIDLTRIDSDWRINRTRVVKNEEIGERKELKTVAEKFAVSYYSYTWGDFSNIESQYYLMTSEMVEREKNRVEKMKKEIEGKPKKYFTVQARVVDYDFFEYEEGKKASLIVNLLIKEIDGAYVQDIEVPETKLRTSGIVDGRGRLYSGSIEDLVSRTRNESVKVVFVKDMDDNKWRVSDLKNQDF